MALRGTDELAVSALRGGTDETMGPGQQQAELRPELAAHPDDAAAYEDWKGAAASAEVAHRVRPDLRFERGSPTAAVRPAARRRVDPSRGCRRGSHRTTGRSIDSKPSPSGLRALRSPMPFVVVSVGAGWASAAVGWGVTTNDGKDLPSVQSTIQDKLAQDLSINDIVTFDADIVGAVVPAGARPGAARGRGIRAQRTQRRQRAGLSRRARDRLRAARAVVGWRGRTAGRLPSPRHSTASSARPNAAPHVKVDLATPPMRARAPTAASAIATSLSRMRSTTSVRLESPCRRST